jgi:hypothetical protein
VIGHLIHPVAAATSGALVLSIISAVTSVTAVVLSIYLNVYRDRRLRPQLNLDFDPDGKSDALTLEFPKEPGCVEHWLRLRVRNAPDKRTAEDVEVTFVGCSLGDGVSQDLQLENRRLQWAATREVPPGVDALARDAPVPSVTATIPPGFYRHVDLIHASNRSKVDEEYRCVPRVCVWPPASARNNLQAAVYDFDLVITAKDANAAYYRVRVSYNGQWSDGAGWWSTHLVVAAPEALAS